VGSRGGKRCAREKFKKEGESQEKKDQWF
jgi:hypothetical protein